MARTERPIVPRRLTAHLVQWLGGWPPTVPLQVIETRRRLEPGWDGNVHPGLGVADPAAGAVLSIPPAAADDVRRLADHGDRAVVLPRLPVLLGLPDRGTYEAVFRWTTAPTPLPDAGQWLPADRADVPAWLQPFGGQVLVATDLNDRHLAGVGIKHHDRYGHELSVVTTPAARGRGLARALVAQAARRVLDDGAVPTYLHDPANAASASVADAAGFPDLGWTSFGISEASRRDASAATTKAPSTSINL